MIAEPHGTSWPSSHPAVLTTFTRVAARELGIGAFGQAALTGLDASVAASRVVLGVHYPSDVASGLLFGRAVARLWPRRRGTRSSPQHLERHR
jgi:undecaprenyl-diphosphatase